MRTAIFVAALALTGCATIQEPVPIGKDTYMVNVDVIGKTQSQGRTIAAKEGNAFCQNQHRVMAAQGFEKHTNGLADFVKLQFKCTTPDDPDYAHPSTGDLTN